MDRPLPSLLLEALEPAAQGLSEFQLLRHLQRSAPDLFPPDLFHDMLTLFRTHFLLFNTLYHLRDELLAQRRGILEIDVLAIRLLPYAPSAGSSPGPVDPLRDYYLDSRNLHDMGAAQLDRMLGAFWSRYLANDRRAAALATLGLADPVDSATIRLRYRRLAMQHHPDRGGDAVRFRAIREAMAILRHC